MPSNADPLPLMHGAARIRRLRVEDLAVFQAYRSEPELARYQGWAAMSDAEAEQFRLGEWHQLAIADVDTDALLGDLGLYLAPDGLTGEIGFTLSTAAQGRGIATCAAEVGMRLLFERTSVRTIIGVTDERNAPSIRLLARIGMLEIASRRAEQRGEPCVELVFGIER